MLKPLHATLCDLFLGSAPETSPPLWGGRPLLHVFPALGETSLAAVAAVGGGATNTPAGAVRTLQPPLRAALAAAVQGTGEQITAYASHATGGTHGAHGPPEGSCFFLAHELIGRSARATSRLPQDVGEAAPAASSWPAAARDLDPAAILVAPGHRSPDGRGPV